MRILITLFLILGVAGCTKKDIGLTKKSETKAADPHAGHDHSKHDHGKKDEQDPSLGKNDDKILYYTGAMLGKSLSMLKLEKHEITKIIDGFKDQVTGAELKVDEQKWRTKVQPFFKARRDLLVKEEKDEGRKFQDRFILEEGSKETRSGLLYKIIKQGSGEYPGRLDIVEVDYTGTLVNGKEFDSGKGIKFPLDRVIKGWTEGIQLVREGGEIELVIPYNLAYGERGSAPVIPGGATLRFKVTLHKIVEKKTPKDEEKKDGDKKEKK